MTRTSFVLTACIIGQIAFALPAGAQSPDLFAGGALEALPGRARTGGAPEITRPLKFEAVRNESHPALRTMFAVGDEVLRLLGEGFGRDAGGRDIQIRVSGVEGEPVVLRVLSWRDDEIRVEVPSLLELGVDGKAASDFLQQLARGKKRVVGPSAELGIALAGHWVAKRSVQLAVAYRDLDGDGSLLGEDCDDFDPRRAPGRQETYDGEGLDEDCNADTLASPPTPPVAALGIDSPQL